MLIPLILAFAICFVLERTSPGWALPQVRGWSARLAVVLALQVLVAATAGYAWHRWMPGESLFELSEALPAWIAGPLAYFIATFFYYWWHRWRHESDFLWRAFHQVHHSARRLEVATAFYKHPAESLIDLAIGGSIAYPLLGLSPEAGAAYMACAVLGELFFHANLRTPRWVGYFFQRPEMHRIHHEHARHRNNYGDITWWDMLFGTYENPATWDARCGFDDAREQRLGDMLAWRDVHDERGGRA